jgi:hypothetical protein
MSQRVRIWKDKKREILSKLGYMRRDRTSNGIHRELWIHKDHPNYTNGGASLESCWRAAVKNRLIHIDPETGLVWDFSEDF